MSKENFDLMMKKLFEEATDPADSAELEDSTPMDVFDSLSRVEMIMFAEEEFDIVLTNEEISECETYGDFLKLCEGKAA